MKGIEVITEFLGKVSFPITKTKLVEAAHNFKMGDDIANTMDALPNKTFGSLEEVIPYVQKQKAGNAVGGIGKNLGDAMRGSH